MILQSNDGQMFVKIFPSITIDKLHAVPCSADPDNFSLIFLLILFFSVPPVLFYVNQLIFFSDDPGFQKTKVFLFPLL